MDDYTFSPATAYDLSGRVALVTGGSRGLGKAMVLGFAAAGADVLIASRSLDSCRELARHVEREYERSALPVAVHVGHWEELEGLVDAAYARFGRLDVLVNNAGSSPRYGTETEVTEDLFDKVIALNLKGPFRLAALAATRMAEDGNGSIINITSAGAIHPRPGILPYAAAKAGLNAITVGLARAYGPAVRVNAIMPGTFLTDVSRHWDEAAFAERAEQFALRRCGRPNEIVAAALYLASDGSSYTTGTVLTVDGGQP